MRTTIDLPDDLFRQAKARAALDGRSLKSLFTEWIRQGLASISDKPSQGLPRSRSELPVIRRGKIKSLPAYSNAGLFDLLDDEDLAG